MERLLITFLIQIITTFSILGIIWFIQLIHYPLLNKIQEGFAQYERAHLKRAVSFVGPLLIIDLIASIFLVAFEKSSLLLKLAAINLILNILYWLWTFLFQLQQHQKLSIGFSKVAIHKLVKSNWVRTIIWCLKGANLIWMIYIHSS